jgi:S-DNA-T family DNA segregation ATPase FtsK/SpoIIIE
MRSTGIRVLAPIPGKGAVGVEIPNSSPEFVGLKELLAKPEFYEHPSPLAFVLGKTVSGEPCIVDLAAMPHMLIAGSTGSGKSVAVHALICSILYRMPPDLVKFVMIDPKRLELPSYSGIPHLYDPRVGPLEATVITNSKQASKALARMVKVMEYRYDLFSKANVRNIDSYTKKQKAAGLPPEYYLVVIIDELADLMITSPKEVEDSVQRLAQMARAVGIHLVLATQRPSVDVITGVIKANLPARIALRVASSIDSRVIVDTTGADCLLGKGDMLYLPPASPEPFRVQGAYVSEKEVESLVQHVKQFGLPQYDDLFSSGSALEFAVEDKKEMKDLIEALKLVLERKRVSQDLLKAHFGSSARATNILSLLEVKQFIQKPEGSNRWEINFDMIEEFISKANNIPEGELMT